MRRLAAALCLATLAAAGCAGLVVRGRLPEDVRRVGALAPGGPFAVDPSGLRLALVGDGLRIVDVATGAARSIDGTPAALAWSPDGGRLAASFPGSDGQSALRLFAPDGSLAGETSVRGRLTTLAWTAAGEIVGASARLEAFSFGAQRDELLVEWDGSAPARVTPIGGTTVTPRTAARFGPVLTEGPALAVAPLGDEIAFTRLRDPPLFPGYFSLVVRHRASGAEREIARVPLGPVAIAYAADSEALWSTDAEAATLRDCADGRALSSLPPGGSHLAVSPRATWRLAGERLLRGSEEVLAFAPGARGAFTAAGLFVAAAGAVHLLPSFAEPSAATPVPEVAEKLRGLRSLRAQKLITPAEYEAERKKVVP